MAKKVKKITKKTVKSSSKTVKTVAKTANTITVKNAEGDPDTTATILIQNKINYTPKISVIIPVYNVEQYLRECLDSVCNQTLREIEIICVDDGSTDSSLEILKEYAQKDNRITVMAQENLHAGVARNAGLAVAKGEYVHFLDSDDWVEKESLEKLYNLAHSKKVDVLKFKNKMYDNVNKQFIENSWINIAGFLDEYTNKTLKIQDNISIIKLPDAPWSGIYKLSFLKDKKIYFDNLICVNDTAFFIEAVSKGTVYTTKDIPLVVYRVNNSKSLIGIRHKNFYCQLAVYNSINKRIKHLPKQIKVQINARTLVGVGYRIDEYFSKDISIEDKEQIFNQVKEFFVSTDISDILNSKQDFIYPVQNILTIRQAILDSKNYEDYDKKQRQNKYRSCVIKESDVDAKTKITIIIPVYNVETYLRECLDSVSNQTLKDIEIICVDDGSTDKSLNILKEYAKKDKRFTIIALKNGGAATARNAGLVFAKGEFVAFMDSDDFYPASDTLEYMYKTAKKHNALICGGAMNYLKNGEIINDPKQLDDGYSFAKDGFINYSDYQYDFGFTRFIYNREFVCKNNIYFPEYLRYEDPIFFIKVMAMAKRFYAIKRPTYVYRVEYKEIQWTLKKAQDVVRGITDGLNLSKVYGLTKMHYQYASKKLHSNWLINNAFSLLPMNDQLLVNMLNAVDLELVRKIDKNYTLPKYKNITSVKVSVIIPCYKVEKFLPQCLDSVINQTLRDIEIICVNDGSPDNSLKILQEYANRDNRIKIINQKNQGLSCSRNNALKLVNGEYVLFLDSDDWIRNDTCELLYNKSKQYNLDMVNFAGTNYDDITKAYNQLNGQKILYAPEGKDHFNRQELEKFLYCIPISACRFFYRMAFLNEHNIRFPEGINFEDNYFVRKALLFVQNYGVESEILYFRRVHGESITQNISKFFNDYIEVLGRVERLYAENNIDKEIIKGTLGPYFNYFYTQYLSFDMADKNKYGPVLFDFYHKMNAKYSFNNEKYSNVNGRSQYEEPLKEWFRRVTGNVLDLENPRTFNEKIQWSKLYDSTPIKTRLADKYLVRDWVAEKIGDEYLIPLLGVYDSFDEIDFDKLPNQFVIKCNHGCAYNIIVKDKSKLDLADVKAKLNKWMAENFAFKYGFELQYRDIKPKIIIEKFIENKQSGGDLYDYKFWCFGGKVYYIQFLSERNIDGLKMAFYDTAWHKQNFVYSHPLDKKNIEKPSNLKQMIELAEKLSAGFNHVRVDFYRMDDGTIYFGEMTFTSASGSCGWNNPQINRYFGKLFRLPKRAYNMDTGEYYCLPRTPKQHKPLIIKPYLLLPYYMLANMWMKVWKLPVLKCKKHIKSVLYAHSHRGKMDMLNANFDKILQSIITVRNGLQWQINTVKNQQNDLIKQVNTNIANVKQNSDKQISVLSDKYVTMLDKINQQSDNIKSVEGSILNINNQISNTQELFETKTSEVQGMFEARISESNNKLTRIQKDIVSDIDTLSGKITNAVIDVKNQVQTFEKNSLNSVNNIVSKLDSDKAELNKNIEQDRVLYFNPFSTGVNTERGNCDIADAPNFENRFKKLISGLSPNDAATIVKIIRRLQLIKGTNYKLDLFTTEEKALLQRVREFNREILKVSDNLYAYKNYLLPINHFEPSVFFYNHGIERLDSVESFKHKDILDVGGFIGDSVLMLSPFTDKKIYSFEATKENYDLMLRTIELNNIKNAVPVHTAVGDKNGEIELRFNGSASSQNDMMVKNPKYIEKCPLIKIDDYVRKHNIDVGLIKVDIEGAEQSFLRGARETITKYKPTLLISIYHNVDDFLDIKPMIESWNLGYKFKIFKPVIESVNGETLLICEQ